MALRLERLSGNPIIVPGIGPRIGRNINGPSLIRVPEWVDKPLGKYYLYFAAHKGDHIRLAYSDRINGPWRTYDPGALSLKESGFLTQAPEMPEEIPPWLRLPQGLAIEEAEAHLSTPRAPQVPSLWEDLTHPHIASPDVHVDHDRKEVRMYYHGLDGFGRQVTRLAISKDGLRFAAGRRVAVDRSYLRVFSYKGTTYGMAMPGVFYRSEDGVSRFSEGPRLFNKNMRHAGLLVKGDSLLVFWTQVGDAPERILVSTVDLGGDWMDWKSSGPREALRPEYAWEGANLPLAASVRSSVNSPVNQLRDPAVYREGDGTFLLYVVAGESGIAIAEVFVNTESNRRRNGRNR